MVTEKAREAARIVTVCTIGILITLIVGLATDGITVIKRTSEPNTVEVLDRGVPCFEVTK